MMTTTNMNTTSDTNAITVTTTIKGSEVITKINTSALNPQAQAQPEPTKDLQPAIKIDEHGHGTVSANYAETRKAWDKERDQSYIQGAVVLADFTQCGGLLSSRGIRPVVILSNTERNSNASYVTVAPLTSTPSKLINDYGGLHIYISAKDLGGTRGAKDSALLVEDMTTLDKAFIVRQVGRVHEYQKLIAPNLKKALDTLFTLY